MIESDEDSDGGFTFLSKEKETTGVNYFWVIVFDLINKRII